MGGLLDVPLFSDQRRGFGPDNQPEVDHEATARRNELAEIVYAAAKAMQQR